MQETLKFERMQAGSDRDVWFWKKNPANISFVITDRCRLLGLSISFNFIFCVIFCYHFLSLKALKLSNNYSTICHGYIPDELAVQHSREARDLSSVRCWVRFPNHTLFLYVRKMDSFFLLFFFFIWALLYMQLLNCYCLLVLFCTVTILWWI